MKERVRCAPTEVYIYINSSLVVVNGQKYPYKIYLVVYLTIRSSLLPFRLHCNSAYRNRRLDQRLIRIVDPNRSGYEKQSGKESLSFVKTQFSTAQPSCCKLQTAIPFIIISRSSRIIQQVKVIKPIIFVANILYNFDFFFCHSTLGSCISDSLVVFQE